MKFLSGYIMQADKETGLAKNFFNLSDLKKLEKKEILLLPGLLIRKLD